MATLDLIAPKCADAISPKDLCEIHLGWYDPRGCIIDHVLSEFEIWKKITEVMRGTNGTSQCSPGLTMIALGPFACVSLPVSVPARVSQIS